MLHLDHHNTNVSINDPTLLSYTTIYHHKKSKSVYTLNHDVKVNKKGLVYLYYSEEKTLQNCVWRQIKLETSHSARGLYNKLLREMKGTWEDTKTQPIPHFAQCDYTKRKLTASDACTITPASVLPSFSEFCTIRSPDNRSIDEYYTDSPWSNIIPTNYSYLLLNLNAFFGVDTEELQMLLDYRK